MNILEHHSSGLNTWERNFGSHHGIGCTFEFFSSRSLHPVVPTFGRLVPHPAQPARGAVGATEGVATGSVGWGAVAGAIQARALPTPPPNARLQPLQPHSLLCSSRVCGLPADVDPATSGTPRGTQGRGLSHYCGFQGPVDPLSLPLILFLAGLGGTRYPSSLLAPHGSVWDLALLL